VAGITAIAVEIALACPFGCCECLYRWKNGQGDVYYSNVGPPAGNQPFDVVVTSDDAAPLSRKIPAVQPEEGVEGKEAPLVVQKVPPDAVRGLLVQRIEEKRVEIRAIESLLTKRPSDARLRRGLRRKKRYLDEDRRRLGAWPKSPAAVGTQGRGGRYHERHP
jgi:hypothetical protein